MYASSTWPSSLTPRRVESTRTFASLTSAKREPSTRARRDTRDTRGWPRRREESRRLSACGGGGEDGVERADEAIVLRRRSDRGPQAPVAPGPDRDVADEDALLEEARVHVRRL